MRDDEIKKRWAQLLNPQRRRETTGKKQIEFAGQQYDRNPFDSDYSRIVMSAPFRRLQDKTQVFPLEKNDFPRTRLTHSIEVSALARSIGVSIENILIYKKWLDDKYRGLIPSLLSVSGLIHDIGNPPFGHFGEESIKAFFTNYFKKSKRGLKKIEINDFTNFDGNVQGFRLLTKLSLAEDDNSYNLTYPTLASIIKYPKSSTKGNKKKKGIEFKKFGYFSSEKDRFDVINNFLGLNHHRHPLAFILEAADDIAYSVSDIEDGCKKGIIKIGNLSKLLKEDRFKDDSNCQELLHKITNLQNSSELLIVQQCRIFIQTRMIENIIDTFFQNHESIISGSYNKELITMSKSYQLREFTKEIAILNFNHRSVQKNELIGSKVISFLLEEFVGSVMSENWDNTKTKEGKLYNLISSNYKDFINLKESYPKKEYNRLRLVTDYISGMTDSFAISLYRELNGHE
jgi:dGTPase